MDLIALIVAVLFIGVAWWACNALASAFGLPATLVTVLQVIIVIFGLVLLVRAFGFGSRLGIG